MDYLFELSRLARRCVDSHFKFVNISSATVSTPSSSPTIISSSPPTTSEKSHASPRRDEIFHALSANGIKAEALHATGHFHFATNTSVDLHHGSFRENIGKYWENLANVSSQEKYNGTVVLVEMSWLREMGISALHLFESLLASTTKKFPQLAVVCMYCSELFPMTSMTETLEFFPRVILDAVVYVNIYYVPPEELLSLDKEKLRYERWTSTYLENQQLKSANAELAGFQTEKTKFEEELRDLRDANKHKIDFISTMSHEIKTPLNCIRASLELLASTDTSVEQSEYLEVMKVATKHLITVLNDILDVSRIESGKMHIEPSTCCLRRMVNILKRSFAGNFPKEIECFVDYNVPNYVSIDGTRINQILFNLVSNASKFTPPTGYIRLSLSLAKPVKNNIAQLHFEVEDNGIGMDEGLQKKLFTPFTQAINGAHGGSGLGLSICKRLLNAMDGDIWVKSKVGSGSTFWFELTAPVVIPKISLSRSLDSGLTRSASLGSVIESPQLSARAYKTSLSGTPLSRDSSLDDFAVSDFRVGDKLTIDELSPLDENKATDPSSGAHHKRFSARPLLEKAKIYQRGRRSLGSARPIVRKTASLPIPRKSKSVMVVEDNPLNVKLMVKVLSKLQITPKVAANGKEAVDAFEYANFDLVFMDLHMPIMDGFTAAKKIMDMTVSRETKPKIIGTTASLSSEERTRCHNSGIHEFMNKPLRYEELKEFLKDEL